MDDELKTPTVAGVPGEHKKRKTTTSTSVKRRYNEKHYSRIPLEVPKELAEAFRAKCKAEGTSAASVLKAAIKNFLAGK